MAGPDVFERSSAPSADRTAPSAERAIPSTERAAPASPSVVDMDDARPRRWGWALLVFGFGGFLAWALLAPIDGGVSAPGTVVVSGYRKAVQPVTSGKIAAILASDGDTVRSGQVLVRLDDTQSRARYAAIAGQWLSGLATEARLVAERTPGASPVFPRPLLEATEDPRATGAIALQTTLLATRRQALASELNAMRESIRGLELQIEGTERSRAARQVELKLLRDQLTALSPLADDGFVPRSRVIEQERAIAALTASIAQETGTLGRTRQAIAETRARMAQREQDARREVETQLADVQRELAALRSQLDGLKFDLDNAEVRSPVDGVVMGLSVHTVGGVVQAGTALMEVVPRGEPLKIEAQVAPHLIDRVRPGMRVDVMFTALNQATTPHIEAEVLTVSADALVEPKQGLSYFKVLVQVTPAGRAALKANEVRAGMPAEVFFRTGERTAMSYLTKPLVDRMRSGLTEP